MKHQFLMACAAVACMTAIAGQVRAQPNRCSDALQFDTTILQRNVAAQLSILNTVNSSNYSQMKDKLGASIPGLFDGSFDSFSEKRSELQSSFSLQQRNEITENLYQRVLSPEGARAYALCLQSNANLVAWVSSTGITNNRIAVTVRNNLPGNATLTYTVSGATPMNAPSALTAGSEETLFFNSPRASDFFLVINGRNAQSNASFTVPPIELPAYVEYRRNRNTINVSGAGKCGAGCNGSTSGCQLHENATLNAPIGYTLMPGTPSSTGRRTIGGPGVNIDPPWTWTSSPPSAPISMTGAPGQCDGANGNSQGIVEYQFTTRAYHDEIVKVQ
jgi:hypothetical protein